MEYSIDAYEGAVKFYSDTNPDIPFLVQDKHPEGRPWAGLEEMADWAEGYAVARQLKVAEYKAAREAKKVEAEE